MGSKSPSVNLIDVQVNEAEGIHNYTCDCQPGWTGFYCNTPTAMSFTGASWAAALHTAGKKDLHVLLQFRYASMKYIRQEYILCL